MLHWPLKASPGQANTGFLFYRTSAFGNNVNFVTACMSLVCVCVLQQITIIAIVRQHPSHSNLLLCFCLFFWHLSAKSNLAT